MSGSDTGKLTKEQVEGLLRRQRILENAIKLRDPHKKVYLALYELHKSATASEVAKVIQQKRPSTHMRLLDLEEMGLVKVQRMGRKKVFEVVV